MPAVARDRVYQRLQEVLAGKDTNPEFAHLSTSYRQGILEILHATQPNLRYGSTHNEKLTRQVEILRRVRKRNCTGSYWRRRMGITVYGVNPADTIDLL